MYLYLESKNPQNPYLVACLTNSRVWHKKFDMQNSIHGTIKKNIYSKKHLSRLIISTMISKILIQLSSHVCRRLEITRKGEMHKLVITNLNRDDAGQYTCQVGERPTRSDVIVDECKTVFYWSLASAWKLTMIQEPQNIWHITGYCKIISNFELKSYCLLHVHVDRGFLDTE